MATTFEELKGLLNELGLTYHPLDDDSLLLLFETETYRNPAGENMMAIVVQLTEEGRYLSIFAPDAFKIGSEHLDECLRFFNTVQWYTKLMRVAVDPENGEARPGIEMPIEDARLTAAQLGRCIEGVGYFLETFHTPITQLVETGTMDEELLPWHEHVH